MDMNNRIGNNIRILRSQFSETQDQLASAISVSKKTISSYENGRNMPDLEMIRAVADHYHLPPQILMTADLSEYPSAHKPVSNEEEFSLLQFTRICFPSVFAQSSDTASFQGVMKKHQKLLLDISRNQFSHFDYYRCFSDYLEFFINGPGYRESAASNLLSLWYLLKFLQIICTASDAFSDILSPILTKADYKIDQVRQEEFVRSVEVAMSRLVSLKMNDRAELLLRQCLKQSNIAAMRDLGDFYTALSVLYDELTRIVESPDKATGAGTNIMLEFGWLGNEYATAFIELVFEVCGIHPNWNNSPVVKKYLSETSIFDEIEIH